MLTLIEETEEFLCKKRLGIYRCHCGNICKAEICKVNKGQRKSCGCTKEIEKDLYKSTKNSWNGMIYRCNNPKMAQYKDYGGRGIKVCDRWQGPQGLENFILDMGLKPAPGYTIDRKDNDGNYEKENCRWVTRKEQSNNRRPYPKKRRKKSGCTWPVTVIKNGRKTSVACKQEVRGKQYDLCEEHFQLLMTLRGVDPLNKNRRKD